jgi:mannose-6-phosphate isomerase-like protein (cupin superfamily)
MNKVARHPRHPAVANMSLDEIGERFVARYASRRGDWNAFADAKIPGYRRAQHRFIGNTSGKPDMNVIPVGAFTLTVMFVPPGEGNAPHTHEVEEVFFILRGHLTVFIEDEAGQRKDIDLGPWDCVSCPAGVIHGYVNNTVEPVYLQVMVGKPNPEFMGFADPNLFAERDRHTRE